MMADIWFEPRYAGLIGGIGGSLIGLWGAALGTAAGILIPRGRGKPLIFGMLYFGILCGSVLLIAGIVALIQQQPYSIWYSLLMPGFILDALSIPFVFVMKRRYTEVELRKMRDSEMLSHNG